MTFNEADIIGRTITLTLEFTLEKLSIAFGVNYLQPLHDISRRLLNEIVEFVPISDSDEIKD